MVKKLEEQKIERPSRTCGRPASSRSRSSSSAIRASRRKTMEQTTDYAISLDPDFANFYPAVPYPGTALYEKAEGRPARARGLVAHGVLVLPAAGQRPERRSGDARDQSRETPLLPAAELHRAPRRRHRPADRHQAPCRRRDRAAPALRRDGAPPAPAPRPRSPHPPTRRLPSRLRLFWLLFGCSCSRALARAAGRRRSGTLRVRRPAHPHAEVPYRDAWDQKPPGVHVPTR